MASPDPDGIGVPGRFNPYETHWPPARNADRGHLRSKLKWVESMNSVVSLDSIDMERLLFTIDTSIKVNKRFQFFLWSQGALQSFLPHETMICLFGDLHGMRVRHEIFSRGLVAPEFEALVGDPIKGFLPELITAWHGNASKPLVYTRDRLPHPSLAHWYEGHMLCHGARDAGGAFGSLFIFLRTPSPASMHEVYLAELLMPHLHMALQRMCQNESDVTGSDGVAKILSDREIQVLSWVRDGKTNHEIGQILSISPLTVKNHVQKILRKLNVSNRAQAVAKGAASGLFVSRADAQRSQ